MQDSGISTVDAQEMMHSDTVYRRLNAIVRCSQCVSIGHSNMAQSLSLWHNPVLCVLWWPQKTALVFYCNIVLATAGIKYGLGTPLLHGIISALQCILGSGQWQSPSTFACRRGCESVYVGLAFSCQPRRRIKSYLPSYPGYFREPYWFSMGLPEISRVIWQVCR